METFSQWMTRKFREWEAKKNGRQSVSSFARFLGVKQPTLSRWMQGDSVPDLPNIEILAKRFGNEVYDVLGLEQPREISVDKLPPKLRDPLEAATFEVERTLMDRGLDPDSDEAVSLAVDIFERHGFMVREIK